MCKSDICVTERQVYKVEEIAKILGLGRTAAYALMKNPPFRVLRVGGSILIPIVSFDRWLNGED